jgi:hypothetical protein
MSLFSTFHLNANKNEFIYARCYMFLHLHISDCGNRMSEVQSLKCIGCSQEYKSKKWFEKHLTECRKYRLKIPTTQLPLCDDVTGIILDNIIPIDMKGFALSCKRARLLTIQHMKKLYNEYWHRYCGKPETLHRFIYMLCFDDPHSSFCIQI